MWKTLQHPNVLSLIGVTMTETSFAMISEWMVNKNINEFVKAHPDENRPRLVSFLHKSLPGFADNHVIIQLSGVARGLIYIHEQGMVHGDLKGVSLRLFGTTPLPYSL